MYPEKLYKLSIVPNYPGDELTIVVPTLTGKPGKWECIFKLGNFEQTGKVTEF